MTGGGREGCGPSQPPVRRSQHHFTAPTGADALQRIGQQWPLVCGNDDQGKPGGLRSLAAAGAPKSAPFHGADGAGALQRIGRQWPLACGIGRRQADAAI